MWSKNKLVLSLDLTTRCNAGCPQCHRTNLNGLRKDKRLPDVVWSLDNFKKAFSVEDCNTVDTFDLCGTFGDPMMVPDIAKITQYIAQSNPKAKIQINTNGSIRSEDVWWDTCTYGGSNLTFYISVEGITQEMHEVYRQWTFLDKILNNMDIISQTQSKIHTQCLVWKHNENHLQEIEQLCRDHGSISHRINVSTRERNFVNGVIEFTKNGKKGILEQSTLKAGEVIDGYVQVERRRYVKENQLHEGALKEQEVYQSEAEAREQGDISCEWGNKNMLVMDYNGQIHPCCFFQNPYSDLGLSSNQPGWEAKFHDSDVIRDYKLHAKELNVFNNSVKNILDHVWYKKTLLDSWTKKPNIQCISQCGKCK